MARVSEGRAVLLFQTLHPCGPEAARFSNRGLSAVGQGNPPDPGIGRPRILEVPERDQLGHALRSRLLAYPERLAELTHRQRSREQVLKDVAVRVADAREARRMQRLE